MTIKAEQEATMRQLWRLNHEGRLQLVGPPVAPITVEQADAAIRLAVMDGVGALGLDAGTSLDGTPS